MTKPVITQEQMEKAIEMYTGGLSARDTAKALGLPERRLMKKFKEDPELCKRFMKKTWKPADSHAAVAMRRMGKSIGEIAAELGFSRGVVSHRISTLCPMDKKGEDIGATVICTVAAPRTVTNATIRERLTGEDWIPLRPGALDYAKIKSRGLA